MKIPLQTGRGVNHGSDLCRNCRQAEAAACSVTLRSLHGPGSNFCHPPAHGVEIFDKMRDFISNLINEIDLIKRIEIAFFSEFTKHMFLKLHIFL